MSRSFNHSLAQRRLRRLLTGGELFIKDTTDDAGVRFLGVADLSGFVDFFAGLARLKRRDGVIQRKAFIFDQIVKVRGLRFQKRLLLVSVFQLALMGGCYGISLIKRDIPG